MQLQVDKQNAWLSGRLKAKWHCSHDKKTSNVLLLQPAVVYSGTVSVASSEPFSTQLILRSSTQPKKLMYFQ